MASDTSKRILAPIWGVHKIGGRSKRHLADAERFASDLGRPFHASVCWLRAEVLEAAGFPREALALYTELLSFYREVGMVLDAATAAVEVARVQREIGQTTEAQETARSSIWLIAELKGHPLAEAAIIDLVCCASDPDRLSNRKFKLLQAQIRQARQGAESGRSPAAAIGG